MMSFLGGLLLGIILCLIISDDYIQRRLVDHITKQRKNDAKYWFKLAEKIINENAK